METFGPSTFIHATFVHATFVHATLVHATSLRATFFHPTFVQGQNLVVYNCNHSSLDQTIKFQTSYRAKPKLDQLQLILSLAQLSPSLLCCIGHRHGKRCTVSFTFLLTHPLRTMWFCLNVSHDSPSLKITVQLCHLLKSRGLGLDCFWGIFS